MAAPDPVIAVDHLHKAYGDLVAVDDLSLRVERGEVYALLGHNGAGKSTTVEILEGHRSRTRGDVRVLGFDPATGGRAMRDRIGIVLQSSGIEPELTVREAIGVYGACYRVRRTLDDVVELCGLGEKLDARIGSLSGGQRRRVDLALGIVGRPDVLFLDEPTTGFDAAARRRAWELVEALCDDGTTVLLTTHYLEEAERLADRVGVMVAGRLVAEGSPAELVGATPDTTVSFRLADPAEREAVVAVLPEVHRVEDDRIVFTSATPTAHVHTVTGWAVSRGVELDGLTVHRPSLEDVYLRLSESGTENASEVEPGTETRPESEVAP